MEYSLHFTFREEWVDERLYFNSPTLKHIVLSPGQRIWVSTIGFNLHLNLSLGKADKKKIRKGLDCSDM